jgi:outer membrane protein assembly factor BamE
MRAPIILLFSTFMFIACVSPQKRFNKIQLGMEKDQVLDLMESPQRVERVHDTDRWTYIYYDHDQRVEKEVQFSDGKAVYAGDHPAPAVSAEEQDKLNAESNRALEQKISAERQENQNNYQKYQDDIKGSGEIRYVPKFTPVQ